MISVFIVGFCLWALSTFRELPVLYPHNARNVTYTLARYIWDCAVALIAQANEMKQTEPVRLLNGIWWAFSFILIYTYTGNLIAFLTVPKVSALINSLEELAAQREVLWTYRAKTAHETLFSTAPSPSTYQKIGQLLKEKPDLIVKTDQEGVEAVLTGKIAFIKEKSWLDFAMEKDYLETKQCRLYQVNQLFFSAGFGWVLQEDVIYKSLFNAE
ncbi:hypothetical protein SK128_004083 [Halocaridina rubra]|uniref:Ionotropic glutamate receptor C-terminal domain-containing protein n=1 Tax=Halocaridina rubra TaxID=373956 RepID=A0AAN8X108_HALRR